MVEGLILAAGRSGRTAPGCKLAFDLAGQTVIEPSISNMEPFCSKIIVVTGGHAETVESLLHGRTNVKLVHNPDFAAGMYSSVKVGLQQIRARRFFLLPGDSPFVSSAVYEALLAMDGEIIVPTYQCTAGHPVLFQRTVIGKILQDDSCETLRQFILTHNPRYVEVGCPGILTDIDTEEDYQKALQWLRCSEERR